MKVHASLFFHIITLGSIIFISNQAATLSQPLLLETTIQPIQRKLNYLIQKSNNLEFFPPTILILLSDNSDVDSLNLMREESLGGLKIDSAATQIIQILGSPEQKNESIIWASDGLYHQYWYYPQQGITLEMVSGIVEKRQRIASIKLTSPSQLRTQRGIGIGSSFTEVYHAYQKEQDRDNSITFELFVAGSLYGGLIFSFKNSCVTEIFLGSAAE